MLVEKIHNVRSCDREYAVYTDSNDPNSQMYMRHRPQTYSVCSLLAGALNASITVRYYEHSASANGNCARIHLR